MRSLSNNADVHYFVFVCVSTLADRYCCVGGCDRSCIICIDDGNVSGVFLCTSWGSFNALVFVCVLFGAHSFSGVAFDPVWGALDALLSVCVLFGACLMLWCSSVYYLVHVQCLGVAMVTIWSTLIALVFVCMFNAPVFVCVLLGAH